MAISPRVGAYQQQMLSAGNSDTGQDVFNKKFGDLAFNTLNAKYPKLINLVVTFKVIESYMGEGKALGAFIIRYGSDICYIPVVVNNGHMVSLEMVYYKSEDRIAPLSVEEVKHIEAANRMVQPKAVDPKKVLQENTQQMFHNIFRPPMSSNPVVTASSEDVADLPPQCKEALASVFMEDKELLAKVAEFYDINKLSRSLASPKICLSKEAESPVIKLDELTKEAAAGLSEEEKQTILKRGYLVKNAAIRRNKVKAIATNNVSNKLLESMELIEIPENSTYTGKGFALIVEGVEVVAEPCLFLGGVVITRRGIKRGGTLVVSNFIDGVTKEDLVKFGAKGISELKAYVPQVIDSTTSQEDREQAESYRRAETSSKVRFFFPTRDGKYRDFVSEINRSKSGSWFINNTNGADISEAKNIEDDIFVTVGKYSKAHLNFVKNLNKGWISLGEDSFMLPRKSMYLKALEDTSVFVSSLASLQKLLVRSNTRIGVIKDGPTFNVINKTANTSTKFNSEADAVGHVVKEYGLTKEAVDTLLQSKDVILLEKKAFNETIQDQLPMTPDMGMSQYSMDTGTGYQPQVNTQLLHDTAELGDEDVMDTGMLASLAGDDDIKDLMVDLTPKFTGTLTNIGKTILGFVLNESKLQDHYGQEEYSSVLNNLRKIFTGLGKVVYDLRSYINMN